MSRNAHPHFDYKKRIAIIHNGIIDNYEQLRQVLEKEHGIKGVSETDTELVANYIGLNLDKGLSLFDSIEQCLSILEGAYSIVLISILEPDQMYIFKNTGTMVIGVADTLYENQGHEKDGEEKKSYETSQEEKKENHKFQIVSSDTTVF